MNDNTNEIKMKACKTCEKLLPLESFHKDKRRVDGHNNECKQCSIDRVIRNRKKRVEADPSYYEKEKEKAKLRMRKKREDPEYRRWDIQRKREFYQKHKEKINNKYKLYMQGEQAKILKRTIAQRRYARKRNLIDSFTVEQWEHCLSVFNHSCSYCGSKEYLQQEHFVPVSKDGEYTAKNIIPACRSCNIKKRDKNFFEWYIEQPFYSKQREKNILKYLGYKDDRQQMALF